MVDQIFIYSWSTPTLLFTTLKSDLKHKIIKRGLETDGRGGLGRVTLTLVTKVLNLCHIGKRIAEIMPVLPIWKFWIFDYRQTLKNLIIR